MTVTKELILIAALPVLFFLPALIAEWRENRKRKIAEDHREFTDFQQKVRTVANMEDDGK